MESKDRQVLPVSQEARSLREELDQFNVETFEIEDLAALDQDAPVLMYLLCSTSDCIYCCSCL